MEYDAPCFKVLASNDTSSAPGHQGGIVIPKDIADFFPELPLETSSVDPTVDVELQAELMVNGRPVGQIKTRYQHQTWGGKRSPERRLTSNLGPVRDRASAGDILLFQRSISDPLHMRLNLVTAENPLFAALSKTIKSKRWGTLDEIPASNAAVASATIELQEEQMRPFSLFGDEVERIVATATKIARVRAFQKIVLKNFGYACAMSGRMLVSASGTTGIDAAHIVPLAHRGTNDVRNGLALSKELHWAFDAGLIGVGAGKIMVSAFAKADARNQYLTEFEERPILSAVRVQSQPDSTALNWHQQNVFLG